MTSSWLMFRNLHASNFRTPVLPGTFCQGTMLLCVNCNMILSLAQASQAQVNCGFASWWQMIIFKLCADLVQLKSGLFVETMSISRTRQKQTRRRVLLPTPFNYSQQIQKSVSADMWPYSNTIVERIQDLSVWSICLSSAINNYKLFRIYQQIYDGTDTCALVVLVFSFLFGNITIFECTFIFVFLALWKTYQEVTLKPIHTELWIKLVLFSFINSSKWS